MNRSPDGGQPTDVRELLTPFEAVTPEQLVHIAPFPVYGLLARPHGLDLRSLGYCSAPTQVVTQPPESWLPDQPHILLQISLHFEGLPTHLRVGRTCELVTIDTQRWPDDTGIERRDPAQMPHYGSPADVPLETDTESLQGFIIERFPIVEQVVQATIHRVLDRRLAAMWTFTLKSTHMWV